MLDDYPKPPIDTRRAEVIDARHAVSVAELHWLAEHAQDATCIIEIGSYLGRSTRALADHLNMRRKMYGIVYAIDPWTWRGAVNFGAPGPDGHMTHNAKDDVWDAFNVNLADHITNGYVIPLRMTSQEAFHKQKSELLKWGPAQLIFIDGNHNYADVKWEIEHYRTLVAPGGILCGHDYDWPAPPAGQRGVTRAVDECLGTVQHHETIWYAKL